MAFICIYDRHTSRHTLHVGRLFCLSCGIWSKNKWKNRQGQENVTVVVSMKARLSQNRKIRHVMQLLVAIRIRYGVPNLCCHDLHAWDCRSAANSHSLILQLAHCRHHVQTKQSKASSEGRQQRTDTRAACKRRRDPLPILLGKQYLGT